MNITFEDFFKTATGREPFPYQKEFALALPSILRAPTGSGKTAAGVLGWLWRRKAAEKTIRDATPRRLVYCLPMRVLVEQTRECAVTWLFRLGLLGGEAQFDTQSGRLLSYNPFAGKDEPDKIRVHLLPGGESDCDWDRFPERDAILVGTQDMLLSRALNRGYGMIRYRWPMHFALLNNDCLWVMDEVQLMGSGLATTTQLQALRRLTGTVSPVRSVWMSATMNLSWLRSVDWNEESDAPGTMQIGDADRSHPALRPRWQAEKALEKAGFCVSKDGKAEAKLVLQRHQPGTRTLIVVNTVKRALAVYSQLLGAKSKAQLVFVHSQFRPQDRQAALKKLLDKPGEHGTIGVCTQVIEAGVDLSAKLLITDLAPWASLVQRFGRCNREGEYNSKGGATVLWIEPEGLLDDKKLKPAPYHAQELRLAAGRLRELTDVGPKSLPPFDEPAALMQVFRQKDLRELFDSTPDLAGADIDVSRFIREEDEHHVQIFWRDWGKGEPGLEQKGPSRLELCAVPIGDIKDSLRDLWRWDPIEKRWSHPEAVYPGLVLMRSADLGGYDSSLGWTGKAPRTEPVPSKGISDESNDDDRLVTSQGWMTIAEHTDRVVTALKKLLEDLPALESWRKELEIAGRWHDAGKAHPIFQRAMPAPPRAALWAKSHGAMNRYERPGFRHELASAFAMLSHGLPDLSVYLAAAHHGKVRLSIRAFPNEKRPDSERRFARGVWESDELPQVDLGGGTTMPATPLTLSYVELGQDSVTGPSWLGRMAALRDTLGPFRLAYLEAVMRAADWRGSDRPSENAGSEKEEQG